MIEPIAAAATVMDPLADRGLLPIVAVAVIRSEPLQPLATYVAVATPLLVLTGEVIVARFCPAQFELKVTVADCVYNVPSDCCRNTRKVVLPPAERTALEISITEGWNDAPEGLPICTDVDVEPATTCTGTVATLPLAVAVTVIVRNDESPAVVSVASAEPEVSVVACVTATPPDVAVNVTGTPAIRLFVASRTNAVIVAELEPSDRMLGVLVVTVTTATVGPVVPPPPPPPVEPQLANEVQLLLPPPHAARARAAKAENQRSLRILVT